MRRTRRRTRWLLLSMAAFLVSGACSDAKAKPISEMNCAELHAYYDEHITPNLAPNSDDLDKQRKAMQDAADLNHRIDEVIPGGCPGSDDW